jgi:P27 family predicted phage terminase small subunit
VLPAVDVAAEHVSQRAVDLPALEMMSVSLATFREACEILEQDGDYVASPNGYAIAHPAVAVRNKAASEFRAWSGKFGLTPSDRVSLGLGVVKGRSMADALEARIGPSPRAAAKRAAERVI